VCVFVAAPESATSNTLSEFLQAELHKSDRPELASANIVISGGTVLRTSFIFTCLFFTYINVTILAVSRGTVMDIPLIFTYKCTYLLSINNDFTSIPITPFIFT
jgi:hypothetical protein